MMNCATNSPARAGNAFCKSILMRRSPHRRLRYIVKCWRSTKRARKDTFMNPDLLTQWFEEYGAAWMGQDAKRAAALFAEDAIYQETPFSDALRGVDAIPRD